LDEFIQTLVTQYEKRRLGKTFVAVRTNGPVPVVGYCTLASGAVACGDLPSDIARKSPQHPNPVVLLARLAVDECVQDERVGERLLADALQRAAALSKSLDIFAVEVVAIDDEAAAFYARYGFLQLLDAPKHLFLPIAVIEAAIL